MSNQSRPVGDSPRPGNDQGIRLGVVQDGITRNEWGDVRLAVTHNLEDRSLSTVTVTAFALFRSYSPGNEVVLTRFPGGWAVIGGAC